MSRIGYFPGADVRNNVLSFLDRNLKQNPELVALRWVPRSVLQGGTDWKLGDRLLHESLGIASLTEEIGRVSGGFAELGLKKGDRVILFLPMSVELYVTMFALQRLGAIPVFLDSWARRGQLGVSAKVVAPKAMVSFEKAFDLCLGVQELSGLPIQVCVGPQTRQFTANLDELRRFQREAPLCAVEQEETALVTFTTGSSGTPKGANRTHRFLAAQHYALNSGLPYEARDIDLPVFPIFSLNNLASGVSTVIPAFDIGVPGEKDAFLLYLQLQSCGVTCTTLSPSLFNGLAAFCKKNGLRASTLRRVVTGGAPVSRDNVADFKAIAPAAKTWVLFGSTEVEPMAHIEADEMLKQTQSTDPEWVEEGVNVGSMVEGLEYRFLKINKGPILIGEAKDWGSLEVAAGEVGELIVAGEHVCRSYYNDEEAFRRAKIVDERGVVWHRTGDLGRIDEQGHLWIVGRIHNVFRRGGQYLFPVRSEIVLKKLPFTRQCAYLGVQDGALGEKAVCVLVPETAQVLSDRAYLSRMESEVRRILDKNSIPVDQVIFRQTIPMDPRHHSKVEYELLRNELMAAALV